MKTGTMKAVSLPCISMLVMISTAINAEERQRPSFADFDVNNDGKLSLEEFAQIGSRRGTPEEMFERLDANGDGYITEDEFQTKRRGGRRG